MLFYIRAPYSTVGNCVLWWAKERKGYTCDLKEAMIVNKMEANDIVRLKRGDKMYEVSKVNAIAKLHVDFQYLEQ